MLPAPILERMARVIFPVGTLPNESEPLKFSEREQIIIRELIFDTEEINRRVLSAMMVMSGMKQGMKYDD